MSKLTITDMFPNRYLRGQDLTKPLLVRITALEQEVTHPRPGVEERVWVLRFEALSYPALKLMPLRGLQRTQKGYGLVLRKTLANEIAEVTQCASPEDWPGSMVVLIARQVANGKVGIAARALKPKQETGARDATTEQHRKSGAGDGADGDAPDARGGTEPGIHGGG